MSLPRTEGELAMKIENSSLSKVCLLLFMILTSAPALAENTAIAPAAVAILGATPFAHKAYGINVVKGRAELISDGQRAASKTNVIVKLTGLKPGRKHVGRIHGGTCSTLTTALMVYKLEPIVADATGEGLSKTQVAEGLPGVADCEWWIAFHEGSDANSPKSAIAVGPVIFVERPQVQQVASTPCTDCNNLTAQK